MLLQSTGPGQASFLSTQAQIFANWSLTRLRLGAYQRNTSGTIQETHHPKISGGLHQQKYWKENLQKWLVQNFSDVLTSRHLYQQWFEQKKNYGRCPWWMYLLYTYTLLRIRKYLQKKIHSSILHDFQVAKFYHHHFNFQRSNCVLRVWRISPNPPFLSPKIQQGAPSRQQQFPLGSCLAFCWLPFVSGWPPRESRDHTQVPQLDWSHLLQALQEEATDVKILLISRLQWHFYARWRRRFLRGSV